jgi:hypothetical protein
MQPKQLPGFTYRSQTQDPYAAFALALQQQRMAQQPQQPQRKGGISGFITNVAKDIAHPVGYLLDPVRNGIAGSVAQLTGNREALRNVDKRSSKNLGLGEDNKNLTGALKSLAGNTAQLGLTFAAPEMKGIANGAKAGAAFSGATALRDNKSLDDALKQIAIGGATGGVLGGATSLFSKGVGPSSLTQKFGQKLEDTGGKLMNSQTNLTRAQMRQIGADAPALFNTMNKKYGLSTLEDIANVSKNVTGKDGVYANGVKGALMDSPGINVSGNEMKDLLSKLLDKHAPLVDTPTRTKLNKQLSNAVQSMYAEQPLNPLANPGAVYDVANSFKANAHDLLGKATTTSSDRQLATVYTNMAKTLEGKLYAEPGVAKALPLVKRDMVNQYTQLAGATSGVESKAYAKLAQEVNGVKNIQQLRSLQQPWVLGAKLEQGTALSSGNAAAQLAGGGGPLKRAGNAIADSLTVPAGRMASNVGNRLAGGAEASTGGLSGALGKLTNSPLSAPIMGNAVATGAGQLTNPLPTQKSQQQQQDQQLMEIYQQLSGGKTPMGAQGGQDPMGQMSGQPQMQPQQPTYTLQQAQEDIAKYPKDQAKIIAYYNFVQDANKPGKTDSPYGKPTAQQYALASRGMGSLQNLVGLIQSDPSQVGKTNAPGQGLPGIGGLIQQAYGTSKYKAVANNIATSLLYLSTGAQANASEIQNFNKNYMPQTGDNQATIQQKLQILQQAFAPFLQGGSDTSATPDLQSVLTQAQQGGY